MDGTNMNWCAECLADMQGRVPKEPVEPELCDRHNWRPGPERKETWGERTFRLLLEIKNAVGEEIFRDAIEIVRSAAPATPRHPPEAGEGREGELETIYTLPRNFICAKGHTHTVRSVASLFYDSTPRCLLRRIALEWAALTIV